MPPVEPLVASETDGRAEAFRADMAALARRSILFQPALDRPDRIPPLFRPPGFGSLVQLILEQQVSVRAAQTMWARLTRNLWPVAPEPFLLLSPETLRACGFSAQKGRYAQSLARAVLDGAIDLDALATMPDDDAIRALTAMKGIGHWTAECYLLWALGRRDVMPAGDLAIQVGLKELAGLAARPGPAALREAADAWRPWRSAAALLLWRVYLDNRAADGSTMTSIVQSPDVATSTPDPANLTPAPAPATPSLQSGTSR